MYTIVIVGLIKRAVKSVYNRITFEPKREVNQEHYFYFLAGQKNVNSRNVFLMKKSKYCISFLTQEQS